LSYNVKIRLNAIVTINYSHTRVLLLQLLNFTVTAEKMPLFTEKKNRFTSNSILTKLS